MRLVQGVVKSTNGEMATIEVGISEGGCGRCHEPGGCGSPNLSRALCTRIQSIDVNNALHAKAGDRVFLGMSEDDIGRVATRIYVIPLFGVLLGAAAGEALTESGSLGGIIGALAGFTLSLAYKATMGANDISTPVMVECSESSRSER